MSPGNSKTMNKTLLKLVCACSVALSLFYSKAYGLELEPRQADQAVVLSYHDVKRPGQKMVQEDVDVERLEDQFEYMRIKGYAVIPLAKLIDHKTTGSPLPKNSVVLTFDDGYQSFYTKVFPLLKKYNYPATLALVTRWMELEPQEQVDYNGFKVSRDDFISWEQAAEMHRSGLVEIASHTHDLHHGVLANAMGSIMPAAITPLFDGSKFESATGYEQRIETDLASSRTIIKKRLGFVPQTLVWPYGQFNAVSREIAKKVGFKSALTLRDYADSDEFDAWTTPRKMLVGNPELSAFKDYLEKANEYLPSLIKRVGDLSDYATTDKAEKGLSLLIDQSAKAGWKGIIVPARVGSQWVFRTQTGSYVDWIQRGSWRLAKGMGVEVAVDVTEILDDPNSHALLQDLASQTSLWGIYLKQGRPNEISEVLRAFPMAYVLLEAPIEFNAWTHRTWLVSGNGCKTNSQCYGSIQSSEQLKWRKAASPYVIENH